MELAGYILPGGKIELQDIGKDVSEEAADDMQEVKRIYSSQVYELLLENRIEITMPMEKAKLVLLSMGGRFDAYFYTPKGIHQAFIEVVSRCKRDNIYLLTVELTSKLRKVQRREYYRYSCALDMKARSLDPVELEAFERKERIFLQELPMQKAIIADISGGGIRFVSTAIYEKNSFLYCSYQIVVNGKTKEYNHISKVLEINEMEAQANAFQYRVQFYSISKQEREEIIRFIFDEERKNMRREKW